MWINLTTPVLEALKDPTYRDFMYSIPETVGVNIWWVAMANAKNIFGTREVVLKTWNQVASLPAIYCGKKHEIDGSGITPCLCTNNNNASCGHPQETKIFHAYWLAGMIAMRIDHTITHPWIILRWLVGIDLEASDAYGTLGDEAEAIDTRFIPQVKKEIEEKERKFFLEITLPWRQKVGNALRSISIYN